MSDPSIHPDTDTLLKDPGHHNAARMETSRAASAATDQKQAHHSCAQQAVILNRAKAPMAARANDLAKQPLMRTGHFPAPV